MFPQVLLLVQNSRLRKLYHHFAEEVECEVKPCVSVAEALVQLVIAPAQVIVIDESVPIFEVTILLDVLAKKPEWNKAGLIVIGFSDRRHLFPQRAQFCTSELDFVSLLKGICATL